MEKRSVGDVEPAFAGGSELTVLIIAVVSIACLIIAFVIFAFCL